MFKFFQDDADGILRNSLHFKDIFNMRHPRTFFS